MTTTLQRGQVRARHMKSLLQALSSVRCATPHTDGAMRLVVFDAAVGRARYALRWMAR